MNGSFENVLSVNMSFFNNLLINIENEFRSFFPQGWIKSKSTHGAICRIVELQDAGLKVQIHRKLGQIYL